MAVLTPTELQFLAVTGKYLVVALILESLWNTNLMADQNRSFYEEAEGDYFKVADQDSGGTLTLEGSRRNRLI
jgi:hypothetical protein